MIVNWQLLPVGARVREGGAGRGGRGSLGKQQAKDFCVCALEKVANWILVFEFCELKTSASNFSSVKLLPRVHRQAEGGEWGRGRGTTAASSLI